MELSHLLHMTVSKLIASFTTDAKTLIYRRLVIGLWLYISLIIFS